MMCWGEICATGTVTTSGSWIRATQGQRPLWREVRPERCAVPSLHHLSSSQGSGCLSRGLRYLRPRASQVNRKALARRLGSPAVAVWVAAWARRAQTRHCWRRACVAVHWTRARCSCAGPLVGRTGGGRCSRAPLARPSHHRASAWSEGLVCGDVTGLGGIGCTWDDAGTGNGYAVEGAVKVGY